MHIDDDRDDEVLDLTDEVDEQDDETPENDTDDNDDPPLAAEDDGDVLVVFGDDEVESEPETPTIRRMREALRDKDRRLKEALAKVPKVEVGEKPDLWDDCDGDPERFEIALDAWKQRKAEAEAAQNVQSATNDTARAEFDSELAEYAQQKTKLARPDFDTAETLVVGKLSPVQQSVVIMAAKNKAAMIYALGKYPDRLDALAEITNPVKLAVAAAELERSLKVQARKKASPPQERMRGGTPNNAPADQKEAALEKEADRTGDRTKLIAYRREQKQKG